MNSFLLSESCAERARETLNADPLFNLGDVFEAIDAGSKGFFSMHEVSCLDRVDSACLAKRSA